MTSPRRPLTPSSEKKVHKLRQRSLSFTPMSSSLPSSPRATTMHHASRSPARLSDHRSSSELSLKTHQTAAFETLAKAEGSSTADIQSSMRDHPLRRRAMSGKRTLKGKVEEATSTDKKDLASGFKKTPPRATTVCMTMLLSSTASQTPESPPTITRVTRRGSS